MTKNEEEEHNLLIEKLTTAYTGHQKNEKTQSKYLQI